MSKEIKTNTQQRTSPGGMMRPGGLIQKPKNTGATVKRLIGYMKKSIILIMVTFVIAVLGTLMQVISPKVLGNATTLLFDSFKNGTEIDFKALGSILLVVALLYVGVSLTNYLQIWIMTHVSQKTTFLLRGELKGKMNSVPISYFDKHSNGNLMSIAVNDMDNIATTLQQSLMQLISSVVLVTGTIWFMFTISPLLTVIAFLLIPGSFLVTKIVMPKTQANFREYLKLQGELNGHIEESYNAHNVIKSFNGEAAANRKFDGFNDAMYESGWKSKFFGGSMMPSMMVLQNIDYVLLAIIGALKVASGGIAIGDMQAFLQYSTQFSRPIAQFGQIWNGILSTVASAERVFEVLDAENLPEHKEKFANSRNSSSKVKFEHVKFSYTKEPLISDFNMDVEKGQMIAIVGRTGAGKSTLLSLLERFYEIDGGSIFVDGMDIRNMEYEMLRSKIGMVLQDTWLFSGTIYENIRYGNQNATEEQIYAAAKAAYVDDFVRRLPDGYNTVLNEDASNISQGQRQLITIARAFVTNPEILVLDEATSNVDSRTEMLIQSAMRRLMQGRTSFVVAHRLSTIYEADRIIVMDNGGIAETGSHKFLLEQNGVYADIYNSQFTWQAPEHMEVCR
ncbi:MAG: ABC transporter ATP-binding protein [Cytobacillus gottheilii]|uniref:ABC transporter ATP-binding protein n=1 Tax=Cytobacillus gottheilii TaxID=859144 RepID=UPI003464A1ED